MMSHALGDSLVSMVIVHNLLQRGVEVTVYGNVLYTLRHWFPGVPILPLPAVTAAPAVLAPFDAVLQMHDTQPFPKIRQWHPMVCTLEDYEYGDIGGCMAERFAAFCTREYAVAAASVDNGMRPVPGLRHRRHRRRVAIHPEATTPDKRWSPAQFTKLARRLQSQGYDVQFVLAPHERERWQQVLDAGITAPVFESVDDLACWLFESGWFIGNDSGVGHLASSLRIPALSLFRRRGVAERWRPAWGNVTVVLPWQWIPTAKLKERFWRQTLTCHSVLRAFAAMVAAEHPTPLSSSGEDIATQ